MSFIHLSTIQPTDGQQELSERNPAFIKNDFKNGIVLRKGETIELVSLRLAFDKIRIVEGENDTLYFQLGDAPNFCQCEAKLTPGQYDEDSLAVALEEAMNTAINLPSFAPQESYDPANTGQKANDGVKVTYTPATATDPSKYSISFNQLENNVIGDITWSKMANDAGEALYALRVPRSSLNDGQLEGVFNGGTFSGDVLAVNSLYAYTPAFYAAEESLENMAEVVTHNVGHDGLMDSMGAQCVAQPTEAVDYFATLDDVQFITEPEVVEGVVDTEGRVCVGCSPSQNYTMAAMLQVFDPAVGGSTGWSFRYNQNDDTVDGTVTVENGDASSNYWNFRFDFPTPIEANDGSGRTGITRLYGVFTGNTYFGGIYEPGGLFWGVGTGADGTSGFPQDARDPTYHTFGNIFRGIAGSDISFFYYQNEVGIGNVNFPVKGFYAQTLENDAETFPPPLDNYYRVAWDTPGIQNADENSYTPSFVRTDDADADIDLDTIHGYPPFRVGFNRARREVQSDFQKLNESDPVAKEQEGDRRISVNQYGLTDYWIQSRNQRSDGSIKIDPTTGGVIPVIQVCVLERMEDKPLYPENGNIVPSIVYEDFADALIPGFDMTLDLVLQARVIDMNKLQFEIANVAQQDPRRANVTAPVAPAVSAFTHVYDTTETGITGTTQVKQSDYPLMASVTVSRGGRYPVKNSVHQATVDDFASYYWVDGMLSRADADSKNSIKFQRRTHELFPKRSFSDRLTINNNRYNLSTMMKFGRLTKLDESVRGIGATDPDNFMYYKNADKDKVLSEYITSNNLANVDRIFGYNRLINIPNSNPVGDGTPAHEIKSTNTIRTHPLTDVFNVELLSEPVQSHNGARGDIGKAIYTATAEELEIDSIDRVVSFTPTNRLPVDLNLAQDKTAYSLTVAIKDVNNRLIGGLRPPSDVTLYKTLPEGTKIERAVEKLKDVMAGKANDKNAIVTSTIGQDNPLLGVIPK